MYKIRKEGTNRNVEKSQKVRRKEGRQKEENNIGETKYIYIHRERERERERTES
jgi:hypothetical protein